MSGIPKSSPKLISLLFNIDGEGGDLKLQMRLTVSFSRQRYLETCLDQMEHGCKQSAQAPPHTAEVQILCHHRGAASDHLEKLLKELSLRRAVSPLNAEQPSPDR